MTAGPMEIFDAGALWGVAEPTEARSLHGIEGLDDEVRKILGNHNVRESVSNLQKLHLEDPYRFFTSISLIEQSAAPPGEGEQFSFDSFSAECHRYLSLMYLAFAENKAMAGQINAASAVLYGSVSRGAFGELKRAGELDPTSGDLARIQQLAEALSKRVPPLT